MLQRIIGGYVQGRIRLGLNVAEWTKEALGAGDCDQAQGNVARVSHACRSRSLASSGEPPVPDVPHWFYCLRFSTLPLHLRACDR